MGKTTRGKRDGTGPFAGSAMRSAGRTTGRRKAAGVKCPVKKKRSK